MSQNSNKIMIIYIIYSLNHIKNKHNLWISKIIQKKITQLINKIKKSKIILEIKKDKIV